MHEVSLVQALIEQVEHEVRTAGHAGRVVRVELTVGRLSGAHADSLRFAFQLLAPDSLLSQATLAISEPCPECRCAACGARTTVEELVIECPQCGSSQITIEGGRDLLLQSIELDEE